MVGDNILESEKALTLPVATGFESFIISFVQHPDDFPHNADVGAKTGFVWRVAAPAVIEISVKAKDHIYLIRAIISPARESR